MKGRLKIDYIGIGLITSGLGCLQVFLDRGEDEDWFSSHFNRAVRHSGAGGHRRRDLLANVRAQAGGRYSSDERSQLLGIGSTGFSCLALVFFYSSTLTPDVNFKTLVLMCSAQSIGLGFLFVPLAIIAFVTIPQRLNADVLALFTMFRNVAGSIGIFRCQQQQSPSARRCARRICCTT